MKELQNLINLIKENPHLPVVPITEAGSLSDYGYPCWKCQFGSSYVTQIMDDSHINDQQFY